MFVIDLITALIIGLLFAFIVYALIDFERGWAAWLPLFLLFFFIPWGAALWIPAFGPPVFGAFWLPPLVIAFFIFLLVAALSPPRRPLTRSARVAEAREAYALNIGLSVFFWILIIASAIGIIVAYAT